VLLLIFFFSPMPHFLLLGAIATKYHQPDTVYIICDKLIKWHKGLEGEAIRAYVNAQIKGMSINKR